MQILIKNETNLAAQDGQADQAPQAKYQTSRLGYSKQSPVDSMFHTSYPSPVTAPYVIMVLHPLTFILRPTTTTPLYTVATPSNGATTWPHSAVTPPPDDDRFQEEKYETGWWIRLGGAVECQQVMVPRDRVSSLYFFIILKSD